ncbi:hypothetical protein [Roseovarius sp. E0-M6]|uniref:hypothetical protein n=1 Tax=Roseovarius sp. E0-M6 TaxID=3127118 RepID=UPI00300FABB3
MFTQIHTRFITIISALAIALTGLTAAPARADDKDTAKWIAGIAALAIIGAGIADANKKKRHRRQQAHEYRNHNDGRGTAYGHSDEYSWRKHNKHARPVPRAVQRKLLPGRCIVRGQTRRGAVRGFGRHCLNRHYGHANSLPQQCAVRARNRNGHYSRVIYRQRCLGQFGYQVARR